MPAMLPAERISNKVARLAQDVAAGKFAGEVDMSMALLYISSRADGIGILEVDEMALRVEVAGDEIRLSGSVTSRVAVEYIARQPEAERERLVDRALEIGVFCLERTSTSQDMEFVRRQVEGLLHQVTGAIGSIPLRVEEGLMAKVGTGNGQVLAPVVKAVEESVRTAERGVEEARKLLHQVDPSRSDGAMGQALQHVKDLLDPKRTDSVSSRVEGVVKGLGDRGGTFATTVTDIIDLALKPLKAEVSKLSDRLLEQEAAAEVVSRTTEKGLPYEIEVVERLQPWARTVGATVEHAGTDNQPGDVVVRFAQTSLAGRSLTVVVEARDRADAKGLKRVTADLESAMRQRQASAAVYVGRSPAAFAKEIGEWADGRSESGPIIACVDGSLELAMRFIVALVRLDDMHQAHHELDATAIQPYVAQIRTSMDRVRSVKTKLTAIDNAAGDIRTDVEALRSEVLNALESVEGLLRKSAMANLAPAAHAA